MRHDSQGRRRTQDQERGLRPIHPVLPQTWTSKAIRVAMSDDDWARLEALRDRWADHPEATTQARALGLALSALVQQSPQPAPAVTNWMDWEREKALRLIRPAS